MKHYLTLAVALVYGCLLILYPVTAQAATAHYTGYYEVGRDRLGRPVLNCQYMFNGYYYWYTTPRSRCPMSIEV